jgi:hypothetical protein
VGRWSYSGTVHGMNQSGKVTAVAYKNVAGDTVTTDRFTLI